MSSSFLAWYCL